MWKDDGQSLLELVVVIAVVTLVVGALTFATIASLRNAQFSKNAAQATKLAQEGIERVRSGRDRNEQVNVVGTSVSSWNGNNTGAGSIWSYHISGDCEKEQVGLSTKCYFKVSTTGRLENIGFSLANFPLDSQVELIPPSQPIFKRVVLLSDDLNSDKIFSNDDWPNAKKVTVIVGWRDFAGDHQSQLTTILRRI